MEKYETAILLMVLWHGYRACYSADCDLFR